MAADASDSACMPVGYQLIPLPVCVCVRSERERETERVVTKLCTNIHRSLSVCVASVYTQQQS
jgi:hypothetical protein